MTDVRMRQSPDGKDIGDPPYLIGSGADNLIWRAQAAGANQNLPASSTLILGLENVPIQMRLEYLYEVHLETEVVVLHLLAAGSYQTRYELPLTTTGTWSSPVNLGDVHQFPLMYLGTVPPRECDEDIMFIDRQFGIAVGAPVDAIRFSVYGNSNNGSAVNLIPAGCRAIIREYLP